MSLKWNRNFNGGEIRHTERTVCLAFAPLSVAFYAYLFEFVWNLMTRKTGGFGAIPGAEKALLIFFGFSVFLALLITMFALVYLPATLSIRRDGTVTRDVLGISLRTRVGTPYFFDVREYTRANAFKKISYFDLHLRGPAGSHLVTMRGDRDNFRALSELARIPLVTDGKDRTQRQK
ncbi:hypothetical protein U5817_17985 [Aromatoleum evansii]|uniref:DUF304 domain-containing protein n=1 Tax=Aromatoleum evansii TaxID=59406 RepID=A0ABZ1AIH2_AROEV|nr:hypothetical protein U5817_17985 [Aromatoleum evansii]